MKSFNAAHAAVWKISSRLARESTDRSFNAAHAAVWEITTSDIPLIPTIVSMPLTQQYGKSPKYGYINPQNNNVSMPLTQQYGKSNKGKMKKITTLVSMPLTQQYGKSF